MSSNTDNLLPFLLQSALQRAHPTPLPSNYVLTLISGPTDPVALGETVTAYATTIASDVWGNGIEFSDWALASLSGTVASGYGLTLASGQSSGSATLPVFDLGAHGADAGSSLVVSWHDHFPSSAVSDQFQLAFSASQGGPFSGAVTVTNGETLAPGGRYCQVTVALATTNLSETPQVMTLRLLVVPPWTWGNGGEWQT